MISLIVFTDKYQGHVRTLYTKWFFITFKLYPNTQQSLFPLFIRNKQKFRTVGNSLMLRQFSSNEV